MHIQYCADGLDISGDPYAAEDATQVRVWTQDGFLVGAARRASDGWHVTASDQVGWLDVADPGRFYESYALALEPLGVDVRGLDIAASG